MSNFPEFYELYNIHHATYTSSTRKAVYNETTPSFTINLNIIRPNDMDLMVEAESLGEFRANAKGTNAVNLREGDLVIKATDTTVRYIIMKKPRWNKLFRRNKINLRPA